MLRGVVLSSLALAACGRIGFDELGTGTGAALALAPAVAASNLNTTTRFVASGGEPPYVFARPLGTGELDVATGAFHAPSEPGAATIAVTDAAGDVATAEISFGGDLLFVVGGFGAGIGRDEVWRSADGVTWELAGRLPEARHAGALMVFEDQLIYAGGSTMPEGSRFDEVWSSLDGALWTQIGTLPDPLYAAGEAVHRGRMWLAGGRISGDSYETSVWSSADGASWQDEVPLTTGIHGGRLTVFDDALWQVAGHESAGTTAAVHQRLDDGSWVPRGMIPVAGEYHGVTSHAGALWAAGGNGLRDRVVSSVDGATWTDHARLPIARQDHTLVGWQGTLWAIGGAPSATWRSTASVDAPWSVTGTFPMQVEGARAVAFTPAPGS